MATIRTGKTFIFKEDANQIAFEALKIDSVMEYAEDMTDENLKEYIRKEMQNFQNDRKHDVSSLPQTRLEPFFISAHLSYRVFTMLFSFILDPADGERTPETW